MAGLSLMALGPFQFEAHGFGFQQRQKEQSTRWASVPVAGGMYVTQWTGGEGATQTIRGAVFQEFGGQGAIEGLKLAARTGTPLPFVDLSATLFNVFGMHVIEDISEDADVFDARGEAMKTAYRIRLRAFQGEIAGIGGLSIVSLFA